MARFLKSPPLPKPYDIDRYLGKAKQRVQRVGIELEGLWSTLPEGVRLTHDGSVRVPPPGVSEEDARNFRDLTNVYQRGNMTNEQVVAYQRLHTRINGAAQGHAGELPSPPIEVDVFPAWMRVHYPQHVNGTCGMHIHMSFKYALHYQRLMVPDYQSTILEYIGRWAKKEKLPPEHPIWERLSGKSVYCQHKFYADLQSRRKGEKGHDQNTPGHRYTVINYAYGRFQTIECRLLPMMDKVDQGIRALEEVIKITNAFLLAATKKEPVEIASVSIDEDPIREEIREFLT